jgi:hypothetical protein
MTTIHQRALALAAAALLAPLAASATTLLSEDFAGAVGGTYGGAIAGTQFEVSGGNIDIIGVPGGSPFTCVRFPEGNCLDLVGNVGSGSIVSTATFALVAGTSYSITFGAELQGYAPDDPHTTSFSVSLGSFAQTLTANGAGAAYSVSFIAPGSEAGRLGFSTLVAGDSVHGAVLDHIVLSAVPVPEPASGLLMLAGLGGVLGLGRRVPRASRLTCLSA